jgi:hypothetical protein
MNSGLIPRSDRLDVGSVWEPGRAGVGHRLTVSNANLLVAGRYRDIVRPTSGPTAATIRPDQNRSRSLDLPRNPWRW